MKKILTYLVIFASALILFSCDKPAPTQLVDDTNSDFEVELLNKNLDDQYYNSGLDTSGITQDLSSISNLISVSGIKITNKDNKTFRFSLAQAMFFDKSKPVKYSNGEILAYKTITPGTIKFNEVGARLDSFRIRYRDLGVPKVVTLGQKYVLYNLILGFPDPFYFSYDASVSFEFIPYGIGNSFAFNIPTPPEIDGDVILEAVEPSEVVLPLFGFVAGPGKDPDREGVASCQTHEAKVLVDHLRVSQPLIGIVVAAVEDSGEARNQTLPIGHV